MSSYSKEIFLSRVSPSNIVELVINKLMNDEAIVKKYNLKRSTVSYSLISKSVCRNYQSIRFNFVIHSNRIPILVVKFYNDKHSNPLIERELHIRQTIFVKYRNVRTANPLALLEINGLKVIVEEACEGKTLYQCLRENRTTEYLSKSIEFANQLHMSLNENLVLSNVEDFANEVENLTSQFIALYKPTSSEESLIMNLVKLLIEWFKNKPVYKRYTTGDFTSNNILLDANNNLLLLDFEYAEETHFYFLEWLKFIYSISVLEKMRELPHRDYSDLALVNALSYYKELNYLLDNPIGKAQWLLFYMKDFVTLAGVLSKHNLAKHRIDLQFNLLTLFAGSRGRWLELIRLVKVSLCLTREGGIAALFEALRLKIRINGLIRTLMLAQ